MASTFTDKLYLDLPGDTDTGWGDAYRNALATLDYLAAADNAYYVNPTYTTAALYPNGLPTNQRHFDTIQGAITQAESDGTTPYTQIRVASAVYAENLTITKSMGIIGEGPSGGVGGKSGGRFPLIRGATGSPTITFTPGAGQTEDIALASVQLDNSHSGSGAVITAWPLLFNANDQGDGNFGTRALNLNFHNVYYADSVLTQDFEALIKCVGWYEMSFDTCQFRFPSSEVAYTGQYPIWAWGHEGTQSKACLLRFKRTDVYHDGVSRATVSIGNNSGIQSIYSTYLRTSLLAVENGAGTSLGDLANSSAGALKYNLFGNQYVLAY